MKEWFKFNGLRINNKKKDRVVSGFSQVMVRLGTGEKQKNLNISPNARFFGLVVDEGLT